MRTKQEMRESYHEVCEELKFVVLEHMDQPIQVLLAGFGVTLSKLILAIDAEHRYDELDAVVAAIRATVSDNDAASRHYDA